VKKLIPTAIKLKFRIIKRQITDLKFISRNRFAQKRPQENISGFSITIKQEIKKGAHFDNKIHNLKLASKAINQVCIYPDELFSFWKIVGNPSESNGFKKGRNIVNQKISEETGGGLCQLSGIIYHTALLANLEILERHNHSVDIYSEEERFTPLGADATVVYGYKDLRIKNNNPFPVQFKIEIEGSNISCSLNSQKEIEEHHVTFNIIDKGRKIEVVTFIENKKVAISFYNKLRS
jgi:vancomycin resistance protein VanW